MSKIDLDVILGKKPTPIQRLLEMVYSFLYMAKKKKSAVGKKISKIMKEGVRRNTRKPVSKTNKRRKVSQKQAVAIALNMKRKKKI